MQKEKHSILCLEDDKDSLDLLSLFFESAGFQVSTCDSLNKCLEEARLKEFSAIILDNLIGNESSIEVCREIRVLRPNVPIIFCSGEARQFEIKKAMEAGGNEYFVKPLDFIELVKTVKRLVEESQNRSINFLQF